MASVCRTLRGRDREERVHGREGDSGSGEVKGRGWKRGSWEVGLEGARWDRAFFRGTATTGSSLAAGASSGGPGVTRPRLAAGASGGGSGGGGPGAGSPGVFVRPGKA